MKLKIDIDDKELIGLVKEQGYKKIRFSVEQQMHRAVRIAIENVVSEKDFKIMFKEALVEVLKTFQIRDLKDIENTLGLKRIQKPEHTQEYQVQG